MSSVTFPVDAALSQRALQELVQILHLQDRNFAARFDLFENDAFRLRFVRVASIVCVALSLLGLAMCVIMIAIDPYRLWLRAEVLLMITFVALASFSWYALPAVSERMFRRTSRFRQRIREWSSTRSLASCTKLANRILKVARALAPYDARYELKDSVLSASRLKNGECVVAWQRELAKFRSTGVAISAASVTVLFRRAGWVVPSACILHGDPQWIRGILERFNIVTRVVDVTQAGAALRQNS